MIVIGVRSPETGEKTEVEGQNLLSFLFEEVLTFQESLDFVKDPRIEIHKIHISRSLTFCVFA